MVSACLRDFLGSLGRSTIKNLLPGKGRKPGGSRGPRSRASLNHHDFSYLRMEAGGIEPPKEPEQPLADSRRDSEDSSAKAATSAPKGRVSPGPKTSRKNPDSTRKTGPGPVRDWKE
jgi:hypothetical protein